MTTILVALYVYIGAQVALYAAIDVEERRYNGATIFASTVMMAIWPIVLVAQVMWWFDPERRS